MRFIRLIAQRAILLLAVMGGGAMAADAPDLRALQNLTKDQVRQSHGQGETKLRLRAMREEALRVGLQAGSEAARREIERRVEAQSAFLDAVYDFGPLMLTDEQGRRIRPAAISETVGEAHLGEDGMSLRIASKVFRVINPARFVLVTPTWRDYLYVAGENYSAPVPAILPDGREEREMWAKWVAEGWEAGRLQAHESLAMEIARLTRDYIGMVRYHLLLSFGYVSRPVVSAAYLAASGGGDMMAINDVALHIDVPSALQANPDVWRLLPQLADRSWMGWPFPAVMER